MFGVIRLVKSSVSPALAEASHRAPVRLTYNTWFFSSSKCNERKLNYEDSHKTHNSIIRLPKEGLRETERLHRRVIGLLVVMLRVHHLLCMKRVDFLSKRPRKNRDETKQLGMISRFPLFVGLRTPSSIDLTRREACLFVLNMWCSNM